MAAASVYFAFAALMLVHLLLWAIARRVIARLEGILPGTIGNGRLWISLSVYFSGCFVTGKFDWPELLGKFM